MSTTLHLVHHLLAKGRRLQQVGRSHDALCVLGRLARFRDLPIAIAEETQARLAEIQLCHGRYGRARRHLTAALGHQPGRARYHQLMATAIERDVRADPERALTFYRQALRLDPQQPDCQAEFGLLALSLGEVEEGLTALRKAAELAPDDPDVLGKVVEGLSQEGQVEETRRLLIAARFRNVRDARFQRLWDDFQFQQLHDEQEVVRRAAPATELEEDGRMVLPFVRPPASSVVAAGHRRIRRDFATSTSPPHLTRPARLPGKKHA